MGYQRSTLILEWPEDSEFFGLEIRMKRLSIRQLLKVQALQDLHASTNSEESIEALSDTFDLLAKSLISWNPNTDLTTIPFATTDLGLIWNAYAALPGWHQLVPDTASTLVTSHRGTALPVFATNTSESYTGIPGGGNLGSARSYYVTASINPAGTLAVIYLPDATGTQNGGAIAVNGSLMHAGYTAWWMDPATGVMTSTTVSSTYSNSNANSQGGADWVLVLRYP